MPDVLNELFVRSAPCLICSQCHESGLEVRPDSDDFGGDARRCAGCGVSIPWERLEFFPDTELCTGCQQKTEQAGGSTPEYCPKCGNVMALKPVYGRGVTHYRLTCPQCLAE